MGSGEDAQFVFAKYDYTAQGNQVGANVYLLSSAAEKVEINIFFHHFTINKINRNFN